MAATQSSNQNIEMVPYIVDEVTFSAMVNNQLESWTPVSALIATGKAITPYKVEFDITTRPTSGCSVSMSHESSSTTTGALGIRFWGGDLTDAVVKVRAYYKDLARGGISA